MKVKNYKILYQLKRNWFKFASLIFNNVIYKEIDKKNFILATIYT